MSPSSPPSQPTAPRRIVKRHENSSTQPTDVERLFRLANEAATHEDFHEANRLFHQAADLRSDKEFWRYKSLGFCPSVFADESAINRYWNRLNTGLDFAHSQGIPIDWRTLPHNGFTPSFNLPHLGRCCRDVKEKFARLFENAFPHDRPTLKSVRKGRKRLRVGFVVTAGHHRGFLHVHRHLLERLSRKKFEVFCFCPRSILDECRKSVRHDSLAWITLDPSFERSVEAVRETRCDIVYHWKVGGGVLDYFLPFARLAPVQCTSYGTHGTSGVSAVDYYLSSALLERESAKEHYTENLVLLDSYATCHQWKSREHSTRAELGLPENGALYFCPHRIAKYHPLFDKYIRRILEQDINGHLVLLTDKHERRDLLLRERLQANLGDDLFQRVILLPRLEVHRYRQYMSVMTCVLDSPVYAGDLTTHDAFEQGIPVVTQEGDLLVQRYTSGLCRLVGVESLVAVGPDDYVSTAVRLGTDEEFLTDVKEKIVRHRSLLFDPDSSVAEYERFFERAVS